MFISLTGFRLLRLLPFPRDGWRRILAGCVALTLGLLGLAWALSLQRFDAERALLMRGAQVQQDNLAVIIAENLGQVVDQGRVMAIAAEAWFGRERGDAAARLSAMVAADRAFLRVALHDGDGRRLYESAPGPEVPALSAAVGAMLATAAARADDAGLRPGPRPGAPEEAWQLPLFFPVMDDRGRARGVLVVTLDLGYFLGVYQHIDLGRSGLVQILLDDGEALAEARPEGLVLGAAGRRYARFDGDIGHQGVFVGTLHGDGREYLSSYRRVERLPFVVVASRATDELLDAHLQARARYIGVLGAFSAVLGLLCYGVARGMRRQGQLFAALTASDAEKRGLIERLEDEKRRAFMLAAHDHLTGLPNRRMFAELAASHLSGARRSRRLHALMYIDLDRFKAINDTLGHHVGDLLLQTVAGRLRGAVRESDVVARLGGDEFAILLTGLAAESDAAAIAGKLIEQVGRTIHDLDGHDLQVSPSIGIALFPRDGADVETLCRHADAAMYQSKRNGRGKYTCFDAALTPAGGRAFVLEQRLPRAIADGELVLHFQPKVRLSDYRITGFEALVRWQHPEYGLIHPGEFIALAERSGLVVELGDWVAEACCRQLAAWCDAGLAPVPIAFNVSARQLQDDRLPERIAASMLRHGVLPQWLEVEITESSLVESIEVAGKVLRALEGMGLSIALDDFGSGFSSLGYVRTFPIHTIKIDREFIADIRNSPDDAVIVSSIITLAHNLKMRVIAEGVELLDQLVHLKTAGCDQVQGYYFSRPVDADAARALLLRSVLVPT